MGLSRGLKQHNNTTLTGCLRQRTTPRAQHNLYPNARASLAQTRYYATNKLSIVQRFVCKILLYSCGGFPPSLQATNEPSLSVLDIEGSAAEFVEGSTNKCWDI